MQDREHYLDEKQRNYLPEVSARKERNYRMACEEETEYLDPETVVHQILKSTAERTNQEQICIMQMDTKMRVIRENFFTRREFQHVMAKPADFLRDMILCAPVGLIAVCISKREVPMKKEEMARLKYSDRDYYREKKRYDEATLKTEDQSSKRLETLCRLAGVKFADFIVTNDQMNEIYSFRDQDRLGKEPDWGWIEELTGSCQLSGFLPDDPTDRGEHAQRRNHTEEAPVKLAWHQCEYADEPVNTPETAIRLVQELIQDSDRERLGVINFSGRKPINFSISAVGQSDFAMVDPKLLLRTTCLSGADTVVLFHNHPSGHLKPSADDYEVTERVGRLCRLCGITLADHVIAAFGNDYCYSVYKGGGFHAISESPYADTGGSMRDEKKIERIEVLPLDDADRIPETESEMKMGGMAAEHQTEHMVLQELFREEMFWSDQRDGYAIFQICDDRMEREESYEFMGMDFMKRHGMEVNGMDYDLVYAGPLTAEETLESLYVRFNLERPEDFKGHSMSVSDVVILKRRNEVKAYFVDSCGFTELPNFVHERHKIIYRIRYYATPRGTIKDLKAQEGQIRNQQTVRRKR